MMDEERRSVPPAPGASALLVIFAVLCLTVLAMLSLSTVQADARLSDASAEAVAGYYAADYQAEEILAQLREGTVPSGVREEAGVYYYKCTVSSTQDLEVEVRVEGDTYTCCAGRWCPPGPGNLETDRNCGTAHFRKQNHKGDTEMAGTVGLFCSGR